MVLRTITILAALVAAPIVLVAGCSSSSDDDNGNGIAGKPLYLVSTLNFTADDTFNLVYIVDSMDENTEFDPANALEVGGFSTFGAPEDNPDRAFYVGSGVEPVLQRYRVSDEGTVSLDGELSFAGYGKTSADFNFGWLVFASADKAYYVDVQTLTLFILNPTEMTITDTIAIDGLVGVDGVVPSSGFAQVDQNRIIIPISWFPPGAGATQLAELIIVDMDTDTLSYDSTTRCGGNIWATKDAVGNMYFGAHAIAGITHAAELSDYPPCILRVLTGADGWDDDYFVDMTRFSGDNRASVVVVPGVGDTAYSLVYGENQPEITAENQGGLYASEVWEYWSYTLGDEVATAKKVPGIGLATPYATGGTFELAGEGEVSFAALIGEGFGSTVVYNTADPAAWEEITTISGFVIDIQQIN